MNNEPIFITGTGVISPLGLDSSSFWRNLIGGESGIAPLTKISTDGLRNSRGGQVKNFLWENYGDEGDCDEASGFAFAAAQEAAQMANLGETEKQNCGLVFSTNFGGAASWEACCDMARDEMFDSETFSQFLPDHAAKYTAQRWENSGPNMTVSNACSSGTHAIGIACDLLRLGKCEIAVAGGFDGIGISTMAGLSILRTISPDELKPFDAKRNGTIFGEGGAMVVLETESSMKKRGATPLAQVLGYGVSSNAHHLTAPDKGGAGLVLSMQKALRNASVAPEQVDYINAHGTGTQMNDVAETEAIQTVFGAHSEKLAVSSIKAATSHLMGAAGAIEAIACVYALQNGILPPTINFETAGEGCVLDYIPNQARTAPIEVALSNSSGIGGNNASIILKKVAAI